MLAVSGRGWTGTRLLSLKVSKHNFLAILKPLTKKKSNTLYQNRAIMTCSFFPSVWETTWKTGATFCGLITLLPDASKNDRILRRQSPKLTYLFVRHYSLFYNSMTISKFANHYPALIYTGTFIQKKVM